MEPTDQLPLHQMNPLSRFSDRAEDYAQYRPSYPEATIDLILQGLLPPVIAADVGAGTGISARLLADRGVQVWAIEPNLAMRQAAIAHPGVTLQASTAEQTGLPDEAVHLVTCFQAFHWFEPIATLREFHRILKPDGRLAIVWNERDRADPFTQRYSDVVRQLSNQHPAESRVQAIQPLFDSPDFHNVRQQTFQYQQTMDFTGLVGRARSISYIPNDATSQHRLMTELQALVDQWMDDQGQVTLSYHTTVFLAEPVPIST